MIALLPSLDRFWRRNPAGYRPGEALDRLQRDLRPYACERHAIGALTLRLPQGPVITVRERPQSLFLAHIVSHRFSLNGGTALTDALTLTIGVGGWLRRGAVRYRLVHAGSGGQRLLAALQRYPQIGEALAQLDFRHAALTLRDGHWQLELEHFAASEVVSRLPAGRRYLRLLPEQRRLLLSVCLMFSQLMEKLDE
ncbi:DUF3156 family protein [Serratia sp. AKBS12]|uniref:DUF3156 family protein n=1 Tax=Serratia sp. AKBS12 TaxID=2974597 RepID=UPI002165878D|nr:DUF3156 family protein [Serratia sp. AKBS12]MCS3405852.1 DUF3156 family protein [Serratia sp. AKBS12]HEI8866700.1 DUF3156 family protein [Serratia odorifera]